MRVFSYTSPDLANFLGNFPPLIHTRIGRINHHSHPESKGQSVGLGKERIAIDSAFRHNSGPTLVSLSAGHIPKFEHYPKFNVQLTSN